MKNTPKIFAHGSYIGTTGYANHTRFFYRELSKLHPLKIRNYTVGKSWDGHSEEPHNNEKYLDSLDKQLLCEQSLWDEKRILNHHPMYSSYGLDFDHNVNIILNETAHHFYYQNYDGPKIAYNVWESTRQPDDFFNKLKEYDQVWVASNWQRDCTIEQGMKPEKVKVIPEAVDGEIFHPNPESTLPEYEDGRFKFVMFGRWDYRKATKEIIESFLEEFHKDEPVDLVLSIDNMFAKDGFDTTENRLKNYNLEDSRLKIKHFPTREEYVKYLQKGHVFLSCARAEGWNLPLIEAMACGTPSIYSDCSAQLEFAKGMGLPVSIKSMSEAKRGEYSSFSQSFLAGEFYEPDFEHLKQQMRDAYVNYKKHKKIALEESKIIREKFTWENAAKIASNEISSFLTNLPENKIEISFNLGPKVEIKGHNKEKYFVEFIDSSTNKVIHSSTITNNMWTKCNKSYFIPWIIKINGKTVHTFDLKDKIVKINFESKALGDTLAWTPQVLEFYKKHKCKVIVSTFHNEWFKNLPEYKDIKFIKPGDPYNSYAVYQIGWFKSSEGDWKNFDHHKTQVNTIPLIQAATDILGLPYKEVHYGIDFTPKKRPIKGKYICIAPRATSGLKEWPYENFRSLAKKLQSEGYKVINISKEGFKGANIIDKKNLKWEDTLNYLYHADLFIGLGSGLSWLNWVLNKHTVMINNFIPHGFEFTHNLTKIENNSVCNNCWVSSKHVFDPGNWDWCPENEGTQNQHICQKSITTDVVYNKVLEILKPKKKPKFTWITGGNESYLPMIEVLAKSLLKYSEYKLIVYGFNCDSLIDLPNVTNKRINYNPKPTINSTHEPDLFSKDYSIYFAKYLASIDSLEENYDNFAWIDGDAFVTENIDNSLQYLSSLKNYPLFMKYFHEDINQWRYHKGIKLEGNYGNELASIKNLKRNPNNKLIATGFYFYNKESKSFFEKCLEWNKELDQYSIKIYTDDNAFSEERVANNILWDENKKLDLPITWNNYYSSKDETLVNSYFLKQGFDVMYDKLSLQPYFIHGPDPSVSPKNANTLNKAFQDYQLKKLMIVAHPDDELIFGGAELIKYGPEYKVICLTNKSNDTRSKEFEQVMKKLNVGSWEIFNHKDDLYNPPERYDIESILLSRQWEKIVTHNPIGEYGHPQHKAVFNFIKEYIDKIILKDILYVFGKSNTKLDKNVLNTKKELLTLYKSEQSIINQLLTNTGDWFKSSDNNINYIEHECIEKYDVNKNKDNYIECYEK